MDKEKKIKKEVADNQEDFILKKIRYYQGTIDDYETFWNKKAAEGEKEECPETKSFVKRNAELNKAFEIIPVEKDDTVICKDVVSGKDVDEKPTENTDEKPSEKEEGGKEEKKDAGLEAEKDGEKEGKEEKKEKKEEKKVEEEEETVEDAKKEEKGEDDEDDEKKKSKKKDKED
jgi:hypothetical protein